MQFDKISIDEVIKASIRIAPYIKQTPLLYSKLLNEALGHNILFKTEALQITGAYKIRGVINSFLKLQEENVLPKHFVAYSSGNHAQALAYAAQIFNVKATIFMPAYASYIKQKIAKYYGAELIITESRKEAETKVLEAEQKGLYNLHPSANDMVIAGNGTICYEALNEIEEKADAIFAPCGSGGLLSGTLIASKYFSDKIEVYGAEPHEANDAAISIKTGKIFAFEKSPKTIADGARTLAITPKIFPYLKELTGMYEVAEEEIIYWTAWIMHLLKITCEPTSALAMAAAARWLVTQKTRKNIIVILSGGNIDQKAYNKIWATDQLEDFPTIDLIKRFKSNYEYT